MPVRSEGEVDIEASAATVMAVLQDMEAWPEWASIYRSVEVLQRDAKDRPTEVRSVVSVAGITDTQVLTYEFGDTSVTWTQVEGGQSKSQEGMYSLEAAGGDRTRVRYRLTVEPALPVPGFVVKLAQKKVVEACTKGLKKQVERRP